MRVKLSIKKSVFIFKKLFLQTIAFVDLTPFADKVDLTLFATKTLGQLIDQFY